MVKRIASNIGLDDIVELFENSDGIYKMHKNIAKSAGTSAAKQASSASSGVSDLVRAISGSGQKAIGGSSQAPFRAGYGTQYRPMPKGKSVAKTVDSFLPKDMFRPTDPLGIRKFKNPMNIKPSGTPILDDIAKAVKATDKATEKVAKKGLSNKLVKLAKKHPIMAGAGLLAGIGMTGILGGGEDEATAEQPVREVRQPVQAAQRTSVYGPETQSILNILAQKAGTASDDSARFRREADTRGATTRAVLDDFIRGQQ